MERFIEPFFPIPLGTCNGLIQCFDRSWFRGYTDHTSETHFNFFLLSSIIWPSSSYLCQRIVLFCFKCRGFSIHFRPIKFLQKVVSTDLIESLNYQTCKTNHWQGSDITEICFNSFQTYKLLQTKKTNARYKRCGSILAFYGPSIHT